MVWREHRPILYPVIPAKAGTHLPSYTLHAQGALGPRFRGNDEKGGVRTVGFMTPFDIS